MQNYLTDFLECLLHRLCMAFCGSLAHLCSPAPCAAIHTIAKWVQSKCEMLQSQHRFALSSLGSQAGDVNKEKLFGSGNVRLEDPHSCPMLSSPHLLALFPATHGGLCPGPWTMGLQPECLCVRNAAATVLFPSLLLISPCLTPRQNCTCTALGSTMLGQQQSGVLWTLKALSSIARCTLKKDDKKRRRRFSCSYFSLLERMGESPQKQLNKEERENKARGSEGRLKGRRTFQVALSSLPSRDPESMSQKPSMTSSWLVLLQPLKAVVGNRCSPGSAFRKTKWAFIHGHDKGSSTALMCWPTNGPFTCFFPLEEWCDAFSSVTLATFFLGIVAIQE